MLLPTCCHLFFPCPQFERDEISEEELFRIFFADGRAFDSQALKQHMVRGGPWAKAAGECSCCAALR